MPDEPLLLGILSDSHKKPDLTAEAIGELKAKGVQHLIHAGDFSLEQNLELLKQSGLPYTAVFGNNDNRLIEVASSYSIYKEPHYFKLDGIRFKLMHLPFYLSGDTEVVIYGHTHAFECEKRGKTLFLNPGELCARNKPVSEYAMLEVTVNEFRVHYFAKDLASGGIKEQLLTFERESS